MHSYVSSDKMSSSGLDTTDEIIGIALGGIPYWDIDAVIAHQLSNCTSLRGSLIIGPKRVCQCRPGASGRYVYVYIIEDMSPRLFEVEIYQKLGMQLRF